MSAYEIAELPNQRCRVKGVVFRSPSFAMLHLLKVFAQSQQNQLSIEPDQLVALPTVKPQFEEDEPDWDALFQASLELHLGQYGW